MLEALILAEEVVEQFRQPKPNSLSSPIKVSVQTKSRLVGSGAGYRRRLPVGFVQLRTLSSEVQSADRLARCA